LVSYRLADLKVIKKRLPQIAFFEQTRKDHKIRDFWGKEASAFSCKFLDSILDFLRSPKEVA
jgi:hypothetical protein